MTSAEQAHWSRVASAVRACAATAEALAQGYRDNHGGSLGDKVAAGRRLASMLDTAAKMSDEANRARAKEQSDA